MTKTKIALLALLVAFAGTASPYAGFSDVDEQAFYADAVAWMVDQNITTGVSAGCFAPDDPISRADAMVFLWRHQGRPSASAAAPFTDVTAAYQQPAIDWAYEVGITTGVSANRVNPRGNITRGDFVTLLARYDGASTAGLSSPFPDVDRAYQSGPIAWAAAEGITTGRSPLVFDPDAPVTRGEAATFMWRWAGSPTMTPTVRDQYCPGTDFQVADDCAPTSAAEVGWRGAGIAESSLTPMSGRTELTRNGQVLENFDLDGYIVVEADNVVIRNGRLRASSSDLTTTGMIDVRGSGLVVENIEIDGADIAHNGFYVYPGRGTGYTARSLDVHSLKADGFKTLGSTLLDRVYLHDRYATDSGAHADAVQEMQQNPTNSDLTIWCSTLDFGIPDQYSPRDVDNGIVSGGQGIWIGRTPRLEIRNSTITSVGYTLGVWASERMVLCNVGLEGDMGWGEIYPDSGPQGSAIFAWDVFEISTGQAIPPIRSTNAVC